MLGMCDWVLLHVALITSVDTAWYSVVMANAEAH